VQGGRSAGSATDARSLRESLARVTAAKPALVHRWMLQLRIGGVGLKSARNRRRCACCPSNRWELEAKASLVIASQLRAFESWPWPTSVGRVREPSFWPLL